MYSNNKEIRDVADVAARIMAGLPPLQEKLHPNQQKIDVHEPEKDELTADDFKKLRAKKEVKKEEVEQIDEAFTELFYYETAASRAAEKGKKGAKTFSKRDEKKNIDLEADELTFMIGDEIDLELPIRDAVILNLPVNPLCSDECPGLCQGCGEKWINLPEDHAHNPEDPRWAGLKGLNL